jgi:hypothetical protein
MSDCFAGAVKVVMSDLEKQRIKEFLEKTKELTTCASIWETIQTYKQVRVWWTLWLCKEEYVDVTGVLKDEISEWLEPSYPWFYPDFSDIPPSEVFYIGYTEKWYTLRNIYQLSKSGSELLLTQQQSNVLDYWRKNGHKVN